MPTRKQPEPEPEPVEPEETSTPAATCVNDGEPAAFTTTNPGQLPAHYCESCAGAIDPGAPLAKL